MNTENITCLNSSDLQNYQHHVYAVVYSVILAPGLLGNVLALWVFRLYVKETKKAVVFMMNLAVADLMQVLSLPLRIYYYLNNNWPFGHTACMFCFYLKYVNMYASIFFLMCISVRRCQLILRPLSYTSSRKKGDWYICAAGWLLVFLCCLPFPLLRNDSSPDKDHLCFSELPMQRVSKPAKWALLIAAELLGFVVPLVLVLTCACLTTANLRQIRESVVHDRGEKRRAWKMVLNCALVFLVCFAPYHVTMPLDFLAKTNTLSCTVQETILRCHPVTLCLASLNSSLDPLMYYFTTDEFRRRLSRADVAEAVPFTRRLSCITGPNKDVVT